MNLVRWKENGCAQCWTCGNRIGQQIVFKDKKIKNLPKNAILPKCGFYNTILTQAPENPCSAHPDYVPPEKPLEENTESQEKQQEEVVEDGSTG